jgi:membrane-associated phospholipid phosphatase
MDASITSTRAAPSPAESRHNWVYVACFEPQPRRRAIKLLGWMTAIFMALVAFFTFQYDLLPLDRQVTEAFLELQRYPWLLSAAEAISFFGYTPWNAVVAAASCMALMAWLGWKTGLFVTIATFIQGFITIILKYPIKVERPMETNLNAPIAAIEDSSFPSGHVTLYIVLFGLLVYLLYKHDAPPLLRRVAFFLAALLILLSGPARILVGAHWVGDVIAAYLLGFFLLLLSIEVYESLFLPRWGRQGDNAAECVNEGAREG